MVEAMCTSVCQIASGQNRYSCVLHGIFTQEGHFVSGEVQKMIWSLDRVAPPLSRADPAKSANSMTSPRPGHLQTALAVSAIAKIFPWRPQPKAQASLTTTNNEQPFLHVFVDEVILKNLFSRMVAFFKSIVHPTSAVNTDLRILKSLERELWGEPWWGKCCTKPSAFFTAGASPRAEKEEDSINVHLHNAQP